MRREIRLDETLLEAPSKYLWHSEHKVSSEEASCATQNVALRLNAIREVEELLKELQEYRKGLERTMNLHKGILSPIHRLPDDLLREIFVHYCEDGPGIQLSPNFTTVCTGDDPVYVLERVCSRWTRVSHSTVQLWASINYHLHHLPDSSTNWDRFMAFSDRLLARSCDAPLCISFLPGEIDFSSAADTARNANSHIFDQLIGSTHRWKELKANARCIALLQRIGIIPNTLPNATLIDLGNSFDKRAPYSQIPDLHPPLLEVPSLRTLKLSNTLDSTALPSINYDFLSAPNLTSVSVAEHPYSRFLLPKLTAYRLETLTITLHEYWWAHGASYAEPLADLVFPTLTTLNILSQGGAWGCALTWVLCGLTCPNLRALAICDSACEKGTEGTIGALTDFLSRSACPLDALTLSRLPHVSVSRVLAIGALHQISDLTIRTHHTSITEVNDVLAVLASISSSYRLRRLWLICNLLAGSAKTQSLSLQHLAGLRSAGIWQNVSPHAAEIHIQVSSALEAGVREELVEFCDTSRGTPIRVSFSDHRAFWKHHFIHKLEEDLEDADSSQDESEFDF